MRHRNIKDTIEGNLVVRRVLVATPLLLHHEINNVEDLGYSLNLLDRYCGVHSPSVSQISVGPELILVFLYALRRN